jgi:beta-glucanase (GH16 family)
MKKLLLMTLLLTLSFLLVACNDEPVEPDEIIVDCELIPTHSSCIEPKVDDLCKTDGYTYDYDSLVYDLVWSDEFSGDSLDLDKWSYEINSGGGGNNELQYYTDKNTSFNDGILSITAKYESYGGRDYTSSRIVTNYKAQWTYGIFEARIKIPSGLGTWPAFWMMPTSSRYGGWPDSGEIDIMEHVGYDENVIHGTVHTEAFNHKINTQKGASYNELDDVTEEFHVYKIEWLPDKINYYVDGVHYYIFDPTLATPWCVGSEEWPFDGDFFLILNLAVGGDWGGAEGVASEDYPTSMEIDYVRVYQSEFITNLEQQE